MERACVFSLAFNINTYPRSLPQMLIRMFGTFAANAWWIVSRTTRETGGSCVCTPVIEMRVHIVLDRSGSLHLCSKSSPKYIMLVKEWRFYNLSLHMFPLRISTEPPIWICMCTYDLDYNNENIYIVGCAWYSGAQRWWMGRCYVNLLVPFELSQVPANLSTNTHANIYIYYFSHTSVRDRVSLYACVCVWLGFNVISGT